MSGLVAAQQRFFLWAYTPHGEIGYQNRLSREYPHLQSYTCDGHILVGLLQRLQQRFAVQVMVSPLHPHLPDGLLLEQQQRCVLDAAAVQSVQPAYASVTRRLLRGGCSPSQVEGEILAARTAAGERRRLCELLQQAAQIKEKIAKQSALFADRKKILHLADNLAKREFTGAQDAREHRRFLSAVTPQGLITFYTTMQALCPRIYVLCDRYASVAALLMHRLRHLALSAGERVISCACTLHPHGAPEHLLLPEKGVAFTVSNAFHTVDFPVYRRIHATRLMYPSFCGEQAEEMQKQLHTAVQQAMACAVNAQEPC